MNLRNLNWRRLRLVAAERNITPDQLIVSIVNLALSEIDKLGLKEGIQARQLSHLTGINAQILFDIILEHKPDRSHMACAKILRQLDGFELFADGTITYQGGTIGKITFNNRTYENVINQLTKIFQENTKYFI